ncbi:MAG: 50S ribosomal protein L10 [Deltaproteobacteria bacterium]|jgi:large subunit ribosomal protein L10|nr:50S ribosomal protein L10 [Deltaproteobacteria bacterium]
MDKDKKKAVLEELKSIFGESKAVFVADFKGLPVTSLNQLRLKVRAEGGTFRVSKNTLTRLALQAGGAESLRPSLTGNNALAFTRGDPVALAKAITDYAKDEERFQIKAGVLGGRALAPGDVKTLSQLPSREALLASLLGTLNAVPGSFVRVLAAVPQKFVRLLAAVGEQKSGSSEAA